MQNINVQSVSLEASFDNDDNAQIHVAVWINEHPDNPDTREVQCVGSMIVSLDMLADMFLQMNGHGERIHNVVEMMFNDNGNILKYYGGGKS